MRWALRREIFARVNEAYRARAEYAAQRAGELPFLSRPKQQGGLYAFLDIRKTGQTSAAFAQKLLARHGAAVIPGTAFGPAGEGFGAHGSARRYSPAEGAVRQHGAR